MYDLYFWACKLNLIHINTRGHTQTTIKLPIIRCVSVEKLLRRGSLCHVTGHVTYIANILLSEDVVACLQKTHQKAVGCTHNNRSRLGQHQNPNIHCGRCKRTRFVDSASIDIGKYHFASMGVQL